jgi:hypothetical protein
MTASLDLWPIGNCQVSALIDRTGRYVWACVPRVDGDPLFSSLLGNADLSPANTAATGLWAIDLEDCVSIEQEYCRNTPILVSRHTDSAGNAIEVVDFLSAGSAPRSCVSARCICTHRTSGCWQSPHSRASQTDL